ncbi:MAG: acetate--CoA ligase family protein, partial [Anaerolineaceae bacterium]|nr:acetate--CoA ligase family protein [Anaerolineaceae bacterium]
MARLHEYQGKEVLKKWGILVPRGGQASSRESAYQLAASIGGEIVVKAQAWVTGRASVGAIRFSESPEKAAEDAEDLLGMELSNYVVETVLIEEKLNIKREFYAGIIIDDSVQAPVVIFSRMGGSGIEQISQDFPDAVSRMVVDIRSGLLDYQARDLVRKTGIHGKLQLELGNIIVKLYNLACHYNARAAEINPIVLTEGGKLYAVDCRITIDDNAVFRFPELGIEIAREFDRPPTKLEKIAWDVEKNDYRGTFYFVQMEQNFKKGDGVIGFHGAGGGGSMMSMDALLEIGYKLANFVDLSGNPPASKVYRGARIIL